jgi:hypothetical protein
MRGKPVLIVISLISSLHLYTFHNNPWLGMLFAAAMGTGLIIFRVTEPVGYYQSLPVDDAQANARTAIAMANTARRALADNRLRLTDSAEEQGPCLNYWLNY